MIKPTIEELTNNGEFNRYELAVAVAKCARIITGEYSKQREDAEKMINKESDKTVRSMVDTDLCDEKSVKLAIEDIYAGKFTMVKKEEEIVEAEESAEAEAAEAEVSEEDAEVSEEEEAQRATEAAELLSAKLLEE